MTTLLRVTHPRIPAAALLLAGWLVFALTGPARAVGNPRLLVEVNPRSAQNVGAGGLTFRYKRVSGPMGFGGDMLMWGVRGFGGRLNDPKIGLMAGLGTLNGNVLKLNLRQLGVTLENGFRPDPRFKWRVTFGGGSYDLKSRISQYSVNKGSFTFLEPMLVGVHPLTRHIILEVAAGYTFAGSTGVRFEGLFLEANLLLGLF